MPPRGDLFPTVYFDGHHLTLEQMEVNTMNPYGNPERTYTFREIEPIRDIVEAEDIQTPEVYRRTDNGNQTIQNPTPVMRILNEITGFRENNNGRIELNHDVEVNAGTDTAQTGDTDGDGINIVADSVTTPRYTISYGADFLNEHGKEDLKPFIQEVLKELLEQEGFIVGRLPKEGESA